ncbi:PKD domain-containing protein [Candidatus Saccharibacteria bacterium]|nr:PKD domain-containing protein [Candidatus Saccharibacteria bacterium]
MKLRKILNKLAAATAAMTFASVVVLSGGVVTAIPYQAGANNGTNYPAFNVFTGTPSEGDESDFFKGKEETNSGPSTNVVNSACNDGTRFTLRVYVHNGANPDTNQGGSGPGVAHGTKVRVQLPGANASTFTPSATISATNATTVSDNMTINCGGKTVKLSYVNGSARQFSSLSGTQGLNDSIVTSGAAIGTYSPNGDVWGCWDQRVYVTLTVLVNDIPNEVTSLGECRVLDVTPAANRTINVNLNGQVTNATIVGYHVDYGDGSSSTQQTSTHQYAQDGTYIIRGTVTVRFADGTTAERTATSCVKQVTFRGDRPPEVVPPTTTPTELPKTGPGAIVATFLAVTSISSAAYYAIVRKFAGV